jgi:hypothetical protein
MPDRVAFSRQHPSIQEVALYYDDMEKSLRLYFSPVAPSYKLRFAGYSDAKVENELDGRLAELDMAAALTLLAAIEAAFRIDYLQRCYLKKKGPVSRAFRSLHKEKGTKVSLEDDIFEVWKKHSAGPSALIGNLRGAFKFRHWLAHGRYWVPRFRTYDYMTIYSLADNVLRSFPLLGPDV